MQQNKTKELIKTEFDGIDYLSPSWQEMGEYTFLLAKDIIESEQKFDSVVALAKGGWTWARALMDYLAIDEISSVRFKSYQGINNATEPQLIQPLTDSIHNQKILLFDEVIDTGVTIEKASEYLKMMGAGKITIATLCYKPHSCIKPNFYAFETSAWVVFPHEIREFIQESYSKWLENNLDKEQIEQRFEKLGISKEQVEYFINHLSLKNK